MRTRGRLAWRLTCIVVFAIGVGVLAVALAHLLLPEVVASLWARCK